MRKFKNKKKNELERVYENKIQTVFRIGKIFIKKN